MFHRFFKQSLDILKNNKRLIENTAFVSGAGTCIYHYPEASRQYVDSHMTLFYSRLSEKEKLAIERDPQKKREFTEKCADNLRLIIGPPD